jgi:transposase-like protein
MTSELVSPHTSESKPARELSLEQASAAAMVAEAKARGLALTGPGGLLKLFTKNVLETALNEEMTERLGDEKSPAAQIVSRRTCATAHGRRRWSRTQLAKSKSTCHGIGRARSSRESRKAQRRLAEVDEIVLSLYAKGMTTGDLGAFCRYLWCRGVEGDDFTDHRRRLRGDAGVGQPTARCGVCSCVLRRDPRQVRDGQVANRPVYAAIGVTVDGHEDVLGLWIGTGGEGANDAG